MPTGCDGGACQRQAGQHFTDLEIFQAIYIQAPNEWQKSNADGTLYYAKLFINATAVSLYESEGWEEACNPSSGALGIFQFLPQYWGRKCTASESAQTFWYAWRTVGWKPWAGDIEGGPESAGTLLAAKVMEPRAQTAYNQFIGEVQKDPPGAQGCPWWDYFCLFTKPGGLNPIVDITSALGNIASLIGNVFHWIQNPLTWKILGLSVAGGILILFGLILLGWDAFKKEVGPGLAGIAAVAK